MEITKDYQGGNIEVVSISGDNVVLKNELRDTGEDWFFWAFCVRGAAGRTIRFSFAQSNRVGYYGAAVSHDRVHWEWSGNAQGESFSYTFGKDENEVYFAHNMVYSPDMFYAFANKKGLDVGVLCRSKKGRDVPCLSFGDGQQVILLTARHHSCESTGSYILEGVIERLLEHPIEGYRVFCVPFVDFDGVCDGDQGKSRLPHDHNRDYSKNSLPIYNETAAIREYCSKNDIAFGFDFHSPWHKGGGNDRVFIPKKTFTKLKRINRFCRLFSECMNENAMLYEPEFDIEPDVGWNKLISSCFGAYICGIPTSEFAFSTETAYFGVERAKFSQSGAVETGRCFGDALVRYINEKSEYVKISFTGDLLCYPDMTAAAKTDDGYDYSPVFGEVKALFAESDSVVGNLETPVAGESLGYTNERYRFNTPDEYIDALRRSGVDTLCLANNHCMDRGEQGIINTLECCRRMGLDTTGLNENERESRVLIKHFGKQSVAIVNYTYGTNAFSHKEFLAPEHRYMVNLTMPEETLKGAINLLGSQEEIAESVAKIYNEGSADYDIVKPYLQQIKSDIEWAKRNAQTVIFCLHSGGQYNQYPEVYTKMLTEKIRGYGADIVIGLHPHIIQPCDIKDGFLKAYCLGNTVYSPSVTAAKASEIDKSYSALLHLYIDKAGNIAKTTFSMLHLCEGDDGLPRLCDCFAQNDKSATAVAEYFSGRKYSGQQREYLLTGADNRPNKQ